ncbi:MAG: glycoside hydrolase family 125 protein [Acetatifactor sp.]|nr:glycoside hydrolase family 125 protein [Acetatifactor sp.]
MGQEEKRKEEELKREVSALAGELAAGLEEGKLKDMFQRCFVSTADTTARFLPGGRAYVITGDIEAMWLRDSSAQVAHYLPYLKHSPMLRELVRGLVLQQMEFICIDPYANAFNQEASGRCFEKDETESSPWVWERKYEVDSLCYPVRLLKQYRQAVGDNSVFGDRTKEALERIVGVWEAQQRHEECSDYSFVRRNCPDSDTLSHNGKGSPCAYTGMTWSGFRPSDDACRYGYLIPANFFAAAALEYVSEFAREIYKDEKLAERTDRLAEQILKGIRRYGIVQTQEFGPIYAYETDGLGHYNLMDDANVPSLLSLPWLEAPGVDEEIWRNTRAFVLSRNNPYYYEGKAARGIGSPHTPGNNIWPIALTMQGLTSREEQEREELLRVLTETDAGTKLMHESFDAECPERFTREWFAWANSLFALFVVEQRNLSVPGR